MFCLQTQLGNKGLLPGVVKAVFLCKLDFGLEEIAENGSGEKFGFRSIADDASVAKQKDAVDLRDDIGDVMGNEENAGPLLGQLTQQVTEFALSADVESVRRLVEEQHLRRTDEGAADHDSALLPSGHLAYGLVRQVDSIDLLEHFVCALTHCGRNHEIGPEGAAGEEAGENGISSRGVERWLTGKFSRDYTEALLEFGKIPALAAKDADLRFGLDDRIALAGNSLNEGGFTAAIRAKNGDVLTGVDAEIDIVEDEVFTAGYIYVTQFEKWWHLIFKNRWFWMVEE